MQFQIYNMACGSCATSVIRAIHSVDPQAKVDMELKLKCITVNLGAGLSPIAAVLQDTGFPPRPAT
ncbi:heavy metal-associated domain protein [Cereibacter sphaeroides WS8N]|uniref:heavy-metal-associated domain-containing protein n=1 Tax=Cereibacter sphaeroides TaxID=1063 RepID=UPI00020B00B6|nr:heavy-metal-associated domain-containing protein [Cereibacter sphaeroides]EGJ19627.1 heavy metal-associated domain protein [Cereibacter sphaeroides WS8N]